MISDNLIEIRKSIPSSVRLVAVSKTKPTALIVEAYNAGERHFGENKATELRDKALELESDIKWHFIGHLQRNKVKYIMPSVHLIHSIDSFRLLKEVNKEALNHGKIVDCLLQFHIAKESTKFGFSIEEVEDLFAANSFDDLKNINITGVMGMATFSNNEGLVRNEFKVLKNIFDRLKTLYYKEEETFNEISMGMSGDYLIAIEEGATIVRIGSSIFGSRA